MIRKMDEFCFKLRVVREIDQQLGSKAILEHQDLIKLKYTSLVIKELLRLWPPVPAVSRLINEEITIEGLYIPKNTEISVKIKTQFILVIILNLLDESFSFSFFLSFFISLNKLSIYCAGRNPEFYAEPLKFKPERFEKENKDE
jgi:cytochrome P450